MAPSLTCDRLPVLLEELDRTELAASIILDDLGRKLEDAAGPSSELLDEPDLMDPVTVPTLLLEL